jgi:hypothetical protein
MSDLPKAKTAGWGVLGMLAAAQFIMVLDTTAMNVSISQVAAGLTPEQVDAVTAEYANAQIAALKAAFAVVALGALVSLWYVRRLPTKAGTGDPGDVPAPAGETAPALGG